MCKCRVKMEAAATTGPSFLSVALPKLNRFLPFSI